jgi:hypothetical protein
MDWKALIGYFAQPVGALINKGLAAGSGAIIAWGVAKGWPMGSLEPLIAMAVLAISTAISGFAATQGIQIPVINKDETNGVKVVAANSPSDAVNAPVK